MIDNVTVIIPAHNRPDRLQRLLDYYHGTGIKVLVPDSSTLPFTGSYDPSEVRYLHRPGLHFLLKIQGVLPMIETDYVLYCADDDFAVPEAIGEIVAFLDMNPDYSVAQGHYLTFIPGKDSVLFYPRYIRNFDSRVTADTSVGRLLQQHGIYAPLLYGVTRTEIFRRIYSYCFDGKGELRFRNLFLAEEFFNHSMLINGKYATLPCFFSARERIVGSATETTVPMSVIKTDEAYREEYEGFIHALALMLADSGELGLDEATATVRSVCACPRDSAAIVFKRKVNSFISRHRALRWASRLSDLRFRQKGLAAVKGMRSYPCTFSTPERDAIVHAILSSRKAVSVAER